MDDDEIAVAVSSGLQSTTSSANNCINLYSEPAFESEEKLIKESTIVSGCCSRKR